MDPRHALVLEHEIALGGAAQSERPIAKGEKAIILGMVRFVAEPTNGLIRFGHAHPPADCSAGAPLKCTPSHAPPGEKRCRRPTGFVPVEFRDGSGPLGRGGLGVFREASLRVRSRPTGSIRVGLHSSPCRRLVLSNQPVRISCCSRKPSPRLFVITP